MTTPVVESYAALPPQHWSATSAAVCRHPCPPCRSGTLESAHRTRTVTKAPLPLVFSRVPAYRRAGTVPVPAAGECRCGCPGQGVMAAVVRSGILTPATPSDRALSQRSMSPDRRVQEHHRDIAEWRPEGLTVGISAAAIDDRIAREPSPREHRRGGLVAIGNHGEASPCDSRR